MVATDAGRKLLAAIWPKFSQSLQVPEKAHLFEIAKSLPVEQLEISLSHLLEEIPDVTEHVATIYLEKILEAHHEKAHPIAPSQPLPSSPAAPVDSPGDPMFDHADEPEPLVPKPADSMPPGLKPAITPDSKEPYALQRGGLPVPKHLLALLMAERAALVSSTVAGMQAVANREAARATSISSQRRHLFGTLIQSHNELVKAGTEVYVEARLSGDSKKLEAAKAAGDYIHDSNAKEIEATGRAGQDILNQIKKESAQDLALFGKTNAALTAAASKKALSGIKQEQDLIASAKKMAAQQFQLGGDILDEKIRQAKQLQDLAHHKEQQIQQLRAQKRKGEITAEAAEEELEAKKRKLDDLLDTYRKYDDQFQEEFLNAVDVAHKKGKDWRYSITYEPPRKIFEDGNLVRVEPGWVKSDLSK